MNKCTTQSPFFNLRVLIGLLIASTGVILALMGFGTFAVRAASMARAVPNDTAKSVDPVVPAGFDCSKIHELGIDKQVNLRARAIMIACGQAERGIPGSRFSHWIRNLLPAPLAYGGTDVDLITGTETYPDVDQSTTFSAINPDNPQQIVIGYNDARGYHATPINLSGASVSTDGGSTFTRLTYNGQSPFSNTVGDPVVLYNKPTGTWYTVWFDLGCGSGGLGGYKSTTPWDPSPASWTHYCVHDGSQDDWESGWADNNTGSPFYGRMYVCWNDFARGGGDIFVRYSTDNGNSWSNEQQVVTNTFVRKVHITGDLVTGDVYIAGLNEGGGGFAPRSNLIFRSTDGGATWINTYTSPTFFGPGRDVTGYFAYMYNSPSPAWPYMGWGQPAAINHVVHYVYSQCGQNVACNTATDHGDVYYIRSTDSGVTFSAPVKLNTDTGTAAQWEPNLSVSTSGTVFAVWYDERTGGSCTPGANTSCYQMFARKSTDNGLSWQPDMTFSDVVSPLPEYPGPIYDYQIGVASSHRTGWMDGRVAINGIQQQDAFTDSEPSVASTPTPTPSPAGCSAGSPACGSIIVGTAPTDFIINLNAPAYEAQGSDFMVNGIPANGATLSNGNTTITFHFNTSPAVQGQNTMHIPACAFPCGDPGGCVHEFTCTFTYQASTPTPTATSTPTATATATATATSTATSTPTTTPPPPTPTPRRPTPRPRPTPAPRPMQLQQTHLRNLATRFRGGDGVPPTPPPRPTPAPRPTTPPHLTPPPTPTGSPRPTPAPRP